MQKRSLVVLAAIQLATIAAAGPVLAQTGRREVGTYVTKDAALRVTAAAPRVELLIMQSPTSMMVFLEGRSVLDWAEGAEDVLKMKRDEVPFGRSEVETTILRHPDPSYGNGVMLTRVFKEKDTRVYMSVWVGRNSYTAIEMSDRDARSVVAALKRAAAEVAQE